MKLIFTGIFLIYSLIAQSQGQVDACITVSKGKLCVGESVTVTNCIVPKGNTPGTGNLFFGDLNDPNGNALIRLGLNEQASHVYSKPGIYKIFQEGGTKNGVPDDTTIIITVIDPKVIDFDILLCEDKIALFQLKEVTNDLYFLQPGDNSLDTNFIYNPNGPSAIEYIYSDTLPKTATVKSECGSTISHPVFPITQLVPPDLISVEGFTRNNQNYASIRVSGLPYLKYQIVIDTVGGTFKDIIRGLPNDTTITYPVLSSNSCFQVIAFDDCTNMDSSRTICLNKINAVSANDQINLTWDPLPYLNTLSSYEVLRNGVSIATVSPSSGFYNDTTVNCGSKYSYAIKGNKTEMTLDGEQLYGISIPVSATAVTSKIPPAITDLKSEIQGNNILITWGNPINNTVKKYEIYRSQNNENYSILDSLTENSYLDEQIDIPGNFYKYKINYTDSCELKSLSSLVVAPVILNAGKNREEKVQVVFNKYNFTDDHIYNLEILDDNNNIINIINLNSDTIYLDPINYDSVASIKYRVKILIEGNPNLISYSNILTIVNEVEIYLPNIFTPNGDIRNEEFLVFGKRFTNFNMSIFNRWWEMIFFSNDLKKGWNGYYKNIPAEPDTYVCLIKVKSFSGEEITKKGSFILVR